MRNQKAVTLPAGYAYTPGRVHRDMFGSPHRWRVAPVPVPGTPYYGGSVAYFDRREDVQRWADQVQQVRGWMAESAAEAAREVRHGYRDQH